MSEASDAPRSRFEFRAWGRRDAACQRLSLLADTVQHERFEDRYLLVGGRGCNVKIRRDRLKIKRLVEERSGFQRWSSVWYRVSSDTPEALEQMLAGLGSTQPLLGADERLLAQLIGELEPSLVFRSVTVTKRRQRFRFGSVRAEASVVEVVGRPGRLRTVAIEGPDLDDLVRLRSSLGLSHVPNLAVHLAVDLDRGAVGDQSSVSVVPPSR